jgi:hypothetical protein
MKSLGNAQQITPSDTTDLVQPTKALYVGFPGNLCVTTAHGQTVTFSEMVPGWYWMAVRRVWATGTTAGEIVAWW